MTDTGLSHMHATFTSTIWAKELPHLAPNAVRGENQTAYYRDANEKIDEVAGPKSVKGGAF